MGSKARRIEFERNGKRWAVGRLPVPSGRVGFQVSGPRGTLVLTDVAVESARGNKKAGAVSFRVLGRGVVDRVAVAPRRFLRVPPVKPVTPKRSSWPRPGVTSLVARDFNGDGHIDLAATAWTDDALHVFEGDGRGGFTHRRSYSSERFGTGLRDIRAADFTGDGLLDLAVTCYVSSHVAVFHGRPGGRFRFAARYDAEGKTAYHLDVADFDRDGDLDLVVGTYSGTVKVLANDGRGSFSSAGVYRRFGLAGRAQNEIRDVVFHDADGDGVLDILVGCAAPESGFLVVLHGARVRDRYTFSRSTPIYLGHRPRAIRAGDWDGDGIADLAVVRLDADDVVLLRGVR